MTIICDCSSHMIVGLNATRGPKPDNRQLKPTLKNSVMKIDKLLGDAGFDGEANHEYCRETKNIRSFFPPLIGRPTKYGKLSGYWRSKMRNYFEDTERISYGQRWQVETTFSMIKRCFTSALSARSYHGRIRQMFLLALTHNIAIFLLQGFLQSSTVTFNFVELLN